MIFFLIISGKEWVSECDNVGSCMSSVDQMHVSQVRGTRLFGSHWLLCYMNTPDSNETLSMVPLNDSWAVDMPLIDSLAVDIPLNNS